MAELMARQQQMVQYWRNVALKMAVRIRVRAIKRCGELLKAYRRQEHSARPQRKMGRSPPHYST